MVCSRFPPLLGGTETHVDEVATRLSRGGMDVTVLTTDVHGDLPTTEARNGFVVRRFRATGMADSHISPGLARAVATDPFDLVHVQGVHTAVPFLALRAAQRRHLPTVFTFHSGGHSSHLRNRLRAPQWRALRPLARRVDTLMAVSEYEQRIFARRFDLPLARFRLVRNGADPLPVGTTSPRLMGSPLVLSVGRLERYKGHHRLIEAMPQLLAMAPGARLGIVGQGPYEPELRELAARRGVAGSVSFVSFDATQRAELGTLLVSADLVALMSDYEAHPVAVMEALALGQRVLAADTSGLSELGRAGLLHAVDPHLGPVDLAQAIVDTVASDQPSGPVVLPSWDDCAQAHFAAYRELLDSGVRSSS
jgi:glycosyltransferase involved in cell wall biosynthesis